jgi:serine protease Do
MDFSNEYKRVKESVFAVVENRSGKFILIGSGVYVDGDYGITCEHCITDINNMYVSFDLVNFIKITNIKTDSNLDLAVFPLTHTNSSVTIRSAKNLEVGNECFLVGFPMNIIQKNASHAYISSFVIDNGVDLIRLDSSVNHGNSGGPLFNFDCELVGIINAKHGNLSKFLNTIQSAKPGASIAIAGINPVQVMQQMIKEMKDNLNLGIGYAVEIDQVVTVEPNLQQNIK